MHVKHTSSGVKYPKKKHVFQKHLANDGIISFKKQYILFAQQLGMENTDGKGIAHNWLSEMRELVYQATFEDYYYF